MHVKIQEIQGRSKDEINYDEDDVRKGKPATVIVYVIANEMLLFALLQWQCVQIIVIEVMRSISFLMSKPP
jgi:hypothetical protein